MPFQKVIRYWARISNHLHLLITQRSWNLHRFKKFVNGFFLKRLISFMFNEILRIINQTWSLTQFLLPRWQKSNSVVTVHMVDHKFGNWDMSNLIIYGSLPKMAAQIVNRLFSTLHSKTVFYVLNFQSLCIYIFFKIMKIHKEL